MLKINAHAHAHWNRPDCFARIEEELSSGDIDYFVTAALDLRLHPGKTVDDLAQYANPYARNFYGFEADTNEHLAELRDRFGEKIAPLVYVDPRDENALRDATYWIKERGFHGVKLYPPMGFYPDDPQFEALFRGLNELQTVLLFHCGRVLAHPQFRMKYANPIYLEGVAVTCPDLKIIVGHFGRPWTYESYCLALGLRNVYIDLTTGGSEDRAMIRRVLDQKNLGAKRLIFGTDKIDGSTEIFQAVRQSFKDDGIVDEDLDMIFGGTAAALFGFGPDAGKE